MSDLIKREDAIEAIDKMICDNKWVCECAINSFPSAEAVSREDYHNLLMASNDIDRALRQYQAKDENPSAEAEWIPCSERLPDELAAVNITWVNHNPPPYYKYTKDVPLVDSAVYYRGKWYWWDATVIDLLGEYDGAYIHGIEPIDKDIEVTAWMPLPKPYCWINR